MPEDGIDLTPSSKLLNASEIIRLASLFVSQGVTKIRLTGGEPTLRKDLVHIVSELSALKGLESIGMTTNGIALERKISPLVEAGLSNLNISLDTLDPVKFELITRRRGLHKVLSSIDTALSLGIKSLKVNVVVMRGSNENEILDFVKWTKDAPITVRFIEYMPFDGNGWRDQKMVPYKTLLGQIMMQHPTLTKASDDPNDTTKAYRIPGFKGQVGFITSMTDHFCGTCNRLRILADGNIKVCLFGNAEVNLKEIMQHHDDEYLLDIIQQAGNLLSS